MSDDETAYLEEKKVKKIWPQNDGCEHSSQFTDLLSHRLHPVLSQGT